MTKHRLLDFRDAIYSFYKGDYSINSNCTFWQLKESNKDFGPAVRDTYRGVCFGATGHGYPGYLGTVVALKMKHYDDTKNINEQSMRKWLNYHINVSPFKDCFVEHDIDTIMQTRLFVVEGKSNGPLMQAGITSLRQGWEKQQLIYSFEAMLDVGVEPDLAFILSHFLYLDKGNLKVSPFAEGHNWAGAYTWSNWCAFNFLSRNPKKHETYYDTGRWSGARAIFEHRGKHPKQAEVRSMTAEVLSKMIKDGLAGKSKVAAKATNPFAKSIPTVSPASNLFSGPAKDVLAWLVKNQETIKEKFCE